MRKKLLIKLLCLLHIFQWIPKVHGFELRTHTLLSERATQASQLNDFLINVLVNELPQGINHVLKDGQSGRVRDLIAEVGAVNEDNGIRSRHHFHDPTRTWNDAGLRWPNVGQVGQSSVLWSQDEEQVLGGKHSWKDARDSYFSALISTDPAERKALFAKTFESLGHLIHLVQDAATPSHTRNDTHIGAFIGQGYGFPIGDPDRFHHWARVKGETAINSADSASFHSSILDQTYNGLVPIAGIIDATTDDRGTPSGDNDIGVAEFSNANFFSDDTILKDYSFPVASQLELVQTASPNNSALRSYLKRALDLVRRDT